MARIDRTLFSAGANVYSRAGVQYTVIANDGTWYMIIMDGASTPDLRFIKSTDQGITWSLPTTINSGTLLAVSVWFDRWSDIAAGKIHLAYIEGVSHDVLYRSIDTEASDALSTETVVYAGASAAAGSCISITRARGGNLGVFYNIDAGAEDGFARSTDVGATWAARADPSEAASGDFFIMLPGWAADNQDMMCFFWDASADEISRKLYDDSANTWAETSIATSMVEGGATAGWPPFSAAVDITNSRNLLAAWSATDAANADMRCWYVTESAITEVTNVVLNGTDDQALSAIGIDTDTQDWYVFYSGKSDGSETWNTSVNIYYKVSTDDGATWGSETLLSQTRLDLRQLITCPRFPTTFFTAWVHVLGNAMHAVSVELPATADTDRAATLVGGALVQ